MVTPDVCAVIPARGGSKGLPGKNIRKLAGHPLIAYSIVAAQASKLIKRVVVSTDSFEIADIARKYGAEVPFLRSDEYARDDSEDIEFVLHLLRWMQKYEKNTPDYLVHLRPTTPLRNPKVIDRAIATILEHPDSTSLKSAHFMNVPPMKWFTIGKDGFFRTCVTDEAPPGYINWPRQKLPKFYVGNAYVDIYKTPHVLKAQELHGDRIVGFVTPECEDIDTIYDFEMVEWRLSHLKKNNVVNVDSHGAEW